MASPTSVQQFNVIKAYLLGKQRLPVHSLRCHICYCCLAVVLSWGCHLL